jgi:hypothetical protein
MRLNPQEFSPESCDFGRDGTGNYQPGIRELRFPDIYHLNHFHQFLPNRTHKQYIDKPAAIRRSPGITFNESYAIADEADSD